jgi:hypothetical protein
MSEKFCAPGTHCPQCNPTDEATRMQMVYDWLSQTISGLEEDEGYVRLADVLAAIPNTGDDSLWFSGAEWQSIINEKNDLQERLETLRGEKIAIEGELARARQTIGAMENFARHPRCEDAEVAEWNHADCGDDCQSKAIEKLVCGELVCMVCGSDSGCAETHIPMFKRLP